jgi:(2Fe-2S) ferredoxin
LRSSFAQRCAPPARLAMTDSNTVRAVTLCPILLVQIIRNFDALGEAFRFSTLNKTLNLSDDLATDLWPLTFGSAYSTLTSLQRKRYLFVCINRRAEDNPKGCCAAKGSEEVYRALKGEVAARGLATLEARVCTSSCLDQCATGVTVLVEPDHFFYGHVTVADVPEIVDGLVKGEPVKRLVVTADQHNEAGWDQRHRTRRDREWSFRGKRHRRQSRDG